MGFKADTPESLPQGDETKVAARMYYFESHAKSLKQYGSFEFIILPVF